MRKQTQKRVSAGFVNMEVGLDARNSKDIGLMPSSGVQCMMNRAISHII
ncbi:MAG: hypothetical protein K2P66_04290 [Lachnospiraceae bacterium]|nr:hypothetical protein [Lachnospiraceae bacterium]